MWKFLTRGSRKTPEIFMTFLDRLVLLNLLLFQLDPIAPFWIQVPFLLFSVVYFMHAVLQGFIGLGVQKDGG